MNPVVLLRKLFFTGGTLNGQDNRSSQRLPCRLPNWTVNPQKGLAAFNVKYMNWKNDIPEHKEVGTTQHSNI
jgi:hypothetical protein